MYQKSALFLMSRSFSSIALKIKANTLPIQPKNPLININDQKVEGSCIKLSSSHCFSFKVLFTYYTYWLIDSIMHL